MEQQALRDWEYKCIQEEPPFCQAACPLHVDVRAFAGHMSAGRLDAARKVLERTMPLPGVLGLVCDHPCEARCRRKDAGDAIRIGELERACIRNSRPGPPPLALPPRGKGAVVIGGGLSSLTAASDLARKGYAVTVLHTGDAPGGLLRDIPADRLPPAALEAEIRNLERLGVRFAAAPAITAELLDEQRSAHGAAYVGLDFANAPAPASLGLSDPNPATLGTAVNGMFLGGLTSSGQPYSPIQAAMDGRRAATSMDRLLQGVSLTASRDREGPFETRLFTSIEGVAPLLARPMADPAGYDPAESAAESQRCLQCQCLECVKVCAYLEQYKGYPKKYAREIYNNLSVVQGMRHANRMILSCSRCGLCAQVCPNNFHMGDLCADVRAEMVRTGKMPPSAHDFALRDLAFNTSPDAALLRHQPGMQRSAWCFLPGCQLAGSSPEHALRAYRHLGARLEGGVGIMLYCCGAPARWAAQADLARRVTDELRRRWQQLGEPTMILGCTTCLERYREELPDIPAVSVWEALALAGLPDTAAMAPTPLWLHDPCTARGAPQVRQAVRGILDSLGQRAAEPRLSGELTECCGYGGLMEAANPDLGARVAKVRAERRADHAEEGILAYCAMCRDSLSRQGKRVYYLLDLLFPDSPDAVQPAAEYPLIRKGLGLPDRHANRTWLKGVLSEGLEAQEPPLSAPHAALRIRMAPDVQRQLDARRILTEDIQRVLCMVESTRNRFRNAATGHLLAGRRLSNVTYWVEYSPIPGQERAFEVHRAWSHRMSVEVP